MKHKTKQMEKQARKNQADEYAGYLAEAREIISDFTRKYCPELHDRWLSYIVSDPRSIPEYTAAVLAEAEKLIGFRGIAIGKTRSFLRVCKITIWAIREGLLETARSIKQSRSKRRATRYMKKLDRQIRKGRS